MSQDPENDNFEPEVVPDDGTAGVAEEPEGQPRQHGLPASVIEELQNLRQENRQRSEELHQARMAMLNQASQQPRMDPVEIAYQKLQSQTDPDAWKYIAPSIKPLLAELASMRDRETQMSQQLEFLTRRDRERETHTQLASLIPDLDSVGPRILEMMKDLPPQVQKMYADNPALFVPLAKSLREGRPMTSKKAVEAARAAVSMDTGGSADRVVPLTADAIGRMDPNSKEFAALQRGFYGS